MKRILITGATGNVGIEVIRFLQKETPEFKIVAGVRNPKEAEKKIRCSDAIEFVQFDFEAPETFPQAFSSVDAVFLLRPPHISDVDRFFKPLIDEMVKARITQVIFLSVQGAERSKIIPHNKIETLLKHSGLPFIFLRPSYFMQNLTTTLLNDIRQKQKIMLPAGRALFNWVDVENIGEVAALLFDRFEEYRNQAVEITGYANLSFETVAQQISIETATNVEFKNLNPFIFYKLKKREGMDSAMILVMTVLHFLPQFQKAPEISTFYESLTNKKPTTLNEFLKREKQKFK